MAGLSVYAETAILNALLRGTNFVAPPSAALRLALCTADPTDAGNLNEIASGTWYTRQLTGAFTAPAPGGAGQQVSNTSSVTFPAVTGAAVTVTHVAVFDSLNAGNMLFSAPMLSSKTLQVGDVLSFAPGTLIGNLN